MPCDIAKTKGLPKVRLMDRLVHFLWPCVCHNAADGIAHGVFFVISVFDEEPRARSFGFLFRCLVSVFV